MSSGVRLAAMMPASLATPMASPLGHAMIKQLKHLWRGVHLARRYCLSNTHPLACNIDHRRCACHVKVGQPFGAHRFGRKVRHPSSLAALARH